MRLLKTVIWVFVVLLLIGGSIIGYFYYHTFGKFPKDTTTYPHYIGYINQDEALFNKEYTLCDGGKIYNIHHATPKDAYQGGKNAFRKSVLDRYKNESFNDTGYVNIRFLVNCKGQAGWFEIIEIDDSYQTTSHSGALVAQLIEITHDANNWAIYRVDGDPKNYYHYVSFKIENGNITEILP